MHAFRTRHAISGLVLAAVLLLSACASRAPVTMPPLAEGQRVSASEFDDYWFAAGRQGRWDILESLLQAGYPIDRANSRGFTATILAAYNGHPDTLRALLKAGANACVGERSGNTALMGALFKGETASARVLIDAPCDLNQENNAGETALTFATLFGRYDLMPAMVSHGADPNHLSARGNTPLRTAQAQRNTQAEAVLRGLGATQ